MGTGAKWVRGLGVARYLRVLAQYTGPNPYRQEGKRLQFGLGRLRERYDAPPTRKYWASAPSSWTTASRPFPVSPSSGLVVVGEP